MSVAVAGWYPNGSHWETYWDGTRWLDLHRPLSDQGHATMPASSTPAETEGSAVEGATPAPEVLVELLPFEASGVIVDVREDGIYLEATTWPGRAAVGDHPRVVAWDDISTLEVTSTGIRLREARKSIIINVPSKKGPQAALVVQRLADHFEGATGRVLPTGKTTRAERTSAIAEVYHRALERKIQEIGQIIRDGDHEREVVLSHDLLIWAKSQKVKEGVQLASEQLEALRRSLGAHVPVTIGTVVCASFAPSIAVFDDRIHRGAEAHAIDGSTQAQVFLDGEIQVTTRPSLTAGLIGSVLPGTALIPAMRFGSKQKTDTRRAEFHVGSQGWIFSMNIPVSSVRSARSIAQRINSIADGIERDARTKAVRTAEAPSGDLASQIERIVALERSGDITAEQATAMKARVIGL